MCCAVVFCSFDLRWIAWCALCTLCRVAFVWCTVLWCASLCFFCVVGRGALRCCVLRCVGVVVCFARSSSFSSPSLSSFLLSRSRSQAALVTGCQRLVRLCCSYDQVGLFACCAVLRCAVCAAMAVLCRGLCFCVVRVCFCVAWFIVVCCALCALVLSSSFC